MFKTSEESIVPCFLSIPHSISYLIYLDGDISELTLLRIEVLIHIDVAFVLPLVLVDDCLGEEGSRYGSLFLFLSNVYPVLLLYLDRFLPFDLVHDCLRFCESF